jgi:hypothetical protein
VHWNDQPESIAQVDTKKVNRVRPFSTQPGKTSRLQEGRITNQTCGRFPQCQSAKRESVPARYRVRQPPQPFAIEAIDRLVPWESFRAAIEAVVLTPHQIRTGRDKQLFFEVP